MNEATPSNTATITKVEGCKILDERESLLQWFLVETNMKYGGMLKRLA